MQENSNKWFYKYIDKFNVVLFLSAITFLLNTSEVYANINTALGSVPTDPAPLAAWVLSKAVGMAGGVAFLLMLYGSFLFLISAGDQNKLQEATDVIMSAIAGLLMILFSIFLLNLIGVQILGL